MCLGIERPGFGRIARCSGVGLWTVPCQWRSRECWTCLCFFKSEGKILLCDACEQASRMLAGKWGMRLVSDFGEGGSFRPYCYDDVTIRLTWPESALVMDWSDTCVGFAPFRVAVYEAHPKLLLRRPLLVHGLQQGHLAALTPRKFVRSVDPQCAFRASTFLRCTVLFPWNALNENPYLALVCPDSLCQHPR